jgi:hypothetical protein
VHDDRVQRVVGRMRSVQSQAELVQPSPDDAVAQRVTGAVTA